MKKSVKKKRKIDFNVPFEIVTKIFDMVSFLEINRDTIVSDITPKMVKFLEKEAKLSGPFKTAFESKFESVLLNNLRAIVQDHFNLNSEEVAIMMDSDFLKTLGLLKLYNKKTFYVKKSHKSKKGEKK